MAGENEDQGDEQKDQSITTASVSPSKPYKPITVGNLERTLHKRLDDSEKRQEKIKKRIAKLDKDSADLRKKIEEREHRTIETLAFFVALFTFISIEFQLFRSLSSGLQVAGLTFLIFGAMLTFVTLIKNLGSETRKHYLIAALASAIAGGFFFWQGQSTEALPEIVQEEVQRQLDELGFERETGTYRIKKKHETTTQPTPNPQENSQATISPGG